MGYIAAFFCFWAWLTHISFALAMPLGAFCLQEPSAFPLESSMGFIFGLIEVQNAK